MGHFGQRAMCEPLATDGRHQSKLTKTETGLVCFVCAMRGTRSNVPLTQKFVRCCGQINKSGICNWLFSAPGSVLVCHQTGEINHPATMGGVWSASTTLWESTVGGLCIGELVLLLLGLAKTPRKQETPRRQIFLRPAYFNRIISYAYRGAENLSRIRKWTKSGERVEFDESP